MINSLVIQKISITLSSVIIVSYVCILVIYNTIYIQQIP